MFLHRAFYLMHHLYFVKISAVQAGYLQSLHTPSTTTSTWGVYSLWAILFPVSPHHPGKSGVAFTTDEMNMMIMVMALGVFIFAKCILYCIVSRRNGMNNSFPRTSAKCGRSLPGQIFRRRFFYIPMCQRTGVIQES